MIIDDDDNYYEVTNEDFMKIRGSGKPTSDAPVFMQKAETEHTNRNFIQIGVICTRDKKTGAFGTTKPIFKLRTKDLEDGERHMLKAFAKAIAPEVIHRIELSELSIADLDKHIAEQEVQKQKKLKELKQEYEFKSARIESEFNREIEYSKSQLLKTGILDDEE